MSELLAYPPHDRMPALLIYGGTGMGKTKILRMFIRDYPAAFDDSVGITHMRVIQMQMPPEPDEKSFYEGLLDALGSRGLSSNRTENPLKSFWPMCNQSVRANFCEGLERVLRRSLGRFAQLFFNSLAGSALP